MGILKKMEQVKTLSAIFHKLRKINNIPLSQPLLDFSWGNIYLEKEYIKLLAEEINIYNLGYDFTDRNFYTLMETVKPNDMETLEENNVWVALDTNIPKWLEQIYIERREQRKIRFNNKNNKLNKKL